MTSFFVSALQNRNCSARAALLALGTVCLATTNAGAQLSPVTNAASSSRLTNDTPQSSRFLLAENGPVAVAETDPAAGNANPAFSSSLPDAPEPQLHPLNAPPQTPAQAAHIAPLYTTTVPAGFQARPLTARNKVILGLRDSVSLESFAAMALSSGYSHLTDGQPNFGVNSKAYAQRLGSAAVRETSQNIFSESIMAPLLHEDPRYYVKGPNYGLVKRTLYAVTRPLITKTDAGNTSINGALLIGYAGAAALTPTYYPPINRNFHDVASTFGASVGGAALGDFVSEFTDDVLTALHLKRIP